MLNSFLAPALRFLKLARQARSFIRLFHKWHLMEDLNVGFHCLANAASIGLGADLAELFSGRAGWLQAKLTPGLERAF